MKKLLIILSMTLLFVIHACKEKEPYKNPKLAIDDRVEDLLKRMTLDEKLSLLSGDTTGFDTKAISRLGVPAIHITDGPLGVRWERSTSFPAGVAMAATWDTLLIKEVGVAMALETRAKGRDYLLGPCVCIHRMPLGGRNFESYSEDPYLASRMAVNWVKGLQSQKVISSVKHYATNDQEWERNDYDVIVDERTLREIHLAPFEAAVKEAGAWTVMAAYNLQNGQHCTENYHLIKDILKGEWGFKGFVVSDWVSVYSTVNAANAGLDLEMPVGAFFTPDSIKKYLNLGLISNETIDDKVRRILTVAFSAGLFDKRNPVDTMILHSKEHKELELKVATEAITLLKNENNILPVDIKKYKTIAVIGPNAKYVATGGGGSSFVSPYYSVSPYEGLKNRFGNSAKILYATGDSIPRPTLNPINSEFLLTPDKKENGLRAEYFGNNNLEGQPILKRIDKQVNWDFGVGSPDPKIKPDYFSARWTGYLKVKEAGKYVLSTLSDDGVRLYFESKKVIENWTTHGPMIDEYVTKLEAGKEYKIQLEYFEQGGGAVAKLGLRKLADTQIDPIDEAVQIASQSDLVIIFAGANGMLESEGRDRDALELPGKQEELIQKVAQANKDIIVVLNGGTPTNTSKWLSLAKGLIHMYYLGQETGNAIAAIIAGDICPSGKLPFSFIYDYSQSPVFKGYKDKSLKIKYDEGIFIGYRYLDKNNINPTFPFGYGLSYTEFEYKNMKINKIGKNEFEITAEIKNIGNRDGDEVVQLYISDKECSVPRPVKELKGFSRVSLKKGESRTISIRLKERDFAFWDIKSNNWKIEPGEFDVMLGKSSRDIVLKSTINVE